jgi:5-methyltetrahydrofolate--homocysteine methyltransferase
MVKEKLLRTLLTRKILILDGAMGTMLQQQGLTPRDFGGPELEGCNEILNLTRPEIIRGIHESYLAAGADIIETNSFGATRVVLGEYKLQDRDIELNKLAACLAREAAAKWSSEAKPRFVAGSMGPTTKMLALTGGITFAELEEAYYRQALGLLEGGVDLLLVETCQDTLNVKAAGAGIQRAFTKLGREVPLIISCTIEKSGTMLAGQNVEAFYISIEHLRPLAVGLNCGSGAELLSDHLRTLAAISSCAVSCYPNAGLPDEEGSYRETPEEFARKMLKFAQNGWLNIAGGCCGTTSEHIKALAAALGEYEPRKHRASAKSCVSGLEVLWPEEDNRPLLVGERTNAIGSRKFRELITAGQWEEASEIARGQVKNGAQVVDICVANPDRDELQDMLNFLPHVVNKVKVPIMLDSTDPEVLEAGLRLIQGKAIINSINLENGLERFAAVVPLIKKYGAAVVVGVIDEQGMALTRERKLAIAERSYDLLVNKYGLLPTDLIFDPLTFPVGTGDAKYLGSAVETIEGLRLIKSKFPECKTILGISNVSFGLPPAGREVLNSVFVYLNTLAGLDYAIVNSEKLERYATIPPEERKLAEDLLLQTSDQKLQVFTDYYRGKKVAEKKQIPSLPLEERLAQAIIEGSKDGLENNLQEALAKYEPLEIINGPLMKGMEEVGNLFNRNQLIVAEVLQSAEVMKAAVTWLKPYLRQAEEAVKGKVLLATVKGDVHDIGKNLVEIILSNNGYQVINLGVKVSSEQIIQACRREKPDAIGLSGLLVKSVQQMLLTAQDLREAGIALPLLLGGAALSRKFTEEKISPEYGGEVYYARDAMDSLSILKTALSKGQGQKETAKDIPAEDYIKEEIKEDIKKDIKEDIKNLCIEKVPTIAQTERQTPTKKEVQSEERIKERVIEEIERPIKEQVEEECIVKPIPEPAEQHLPTIFTRQLLFAYPLNEIIPSLNRDRLLRRYLGVAQKVSDKSPTDQALGSQAKAAQVNASYDRAPETAKKMMPFKDKALEFEKLLDDFLSEVQEKNLLQARGVFAFFPAYSEGDSIYILNPQDEQTVLEKFTFPRQKGKEGLCLADFIRPQNYGAPDYLGMMALTTGLGIGRQADELKFKGEYLKSHLLQSLALELAEAFAEVMQAKMYRIWELYQAEGSALEHKEEDELKLSLKNKLKHQLKYELNSELKNGLKPELMPKSDPNLKGKKESLQIQGIRVSPGYPVCPDLEDQRKIFRLLKPEEIGLTLTESLMMEPEASVTALVFCQPEAKIFHIPR